MAALKSAHPPFPLPSDTLRQFGQPPALFYARDLVSSRTDAEAAASLGITRQLLHTWTTQAFLGKGNLPALEATRRLEVDAKNPAAYTANRTLLSLSAARLPIRR